MYQSNGAYYIGTEMLTNELWSWDERQGKKTVHAKTRESNHKPGRPEEGETERERTSY